MTMSTEKNTITPSKTNVVIKLVPPDGGWGWMVLLGTALSTVEGVKEEMTLKDAPIFHEGCCSVKLLMIPDATKTFCGDLRDDLLSIPWIHRVGAGSIVWQREELRQCLGLAIPGIFNVSMLSLFTLIYGDALESMGHNTKGAAIVLNTMLFVSNFGGPLAGAIVKLTSPRLTAVLGASLCTIGIFSSGFSTNIWHLIITFGILLGIGLDLIANSSFVAINSYFKQKKSQAMGIATVGTSVGQMVMPHLVRYFLETYGFRGTCLLLSSLSFHGVAGSMLLQPVERHMKKIIEDVPDISLTRSTESNKKLSKPNQQQIAMNSVNETTNQETKEKLNGGENSRTSATTVVNTGKKPSLLRKIYDLFGIALLSDVRFINIIIGIALTTTSTANFSLLYPLFLQKAAFMDKQQTANCMSAVAGADMVGRLTLPVLQDKFKIKTRWMLIITCVFVIVVRQILAYQTDMAVLLTLSAFYGFIRSMTVVTKNVAISENCKPEQVPAAVGLGMLTMGIVAAPVGYFLGWIRDYTGSYIICISAQNALLIILLVAWIPDMLYLHLKENRN